MNTIKKLFKRLFNISDKRYLPTRLASSIVMPEEQVRLYRCAHTLYVNTVKDISHITGVLYLTNHREEDVPFCLSLSFYESKHLNSSDIFYRGVVPAGGSECVPIGGISRGERLYIKTETGELCVQLRGVIHRV